MRKIYFLMLILFLLLANSRLSAECSVNISTSTNTTQLTCKDTSITLTAIATINGTDTAFLWSNGATTSSINVFNPGIYTVTITGDNLACTTSVSIIITRDTGAPTATVLAFPDTICRGGASTLVALGTHTYSWEPGSLTGAVVSVNPLSTTMYTVIGTAANGCADTSAIQIFVNQLPTASISGTATVCQNAAIPPQITFRGLSGKAPFTFAYNLNGGSPQTIATTGTDTFVTIGAPTGVLGSFSYNLVSVSDGNGCVQIQSGSATVMVSPGIRLTSSKTGGICSGTPFFYSAVSSDPVNTSYSWKRPAVPGISNTADSGLTQTINETLHNTTSQPVLITYFFTLTAGVGCVITEPVHVTVNPIPVTDPISNDTLCNGVFVSGGILFTSNTPGASFSWTNSNTTIGLPAGGSGSIPAFIATNTTNNLISAIITVAIKASADSCPGISRTFTIFVRPEPILTSDKTASICDSARFTYQATSPAAGTIFRWTRPAVNGINNNQPGFDTTGSINETLDNFTTQSKVVTYFFTLSTGPGCIIMDSVKVTVNPTPVIMVTNPGTVCDSTGFTITATSADQTVSFSWIRPSVTGINNPPDSGVSGTIHETLDNTNTQPIIVTYIFTLISGTGCISKTSVHITVNPTPLINPVRDTIFCNGNFVNLGILFTSTPPGASFKWKSKHANIGLPDTGIGNIPPFIAKNTTTGSITDTITVFIQPGANSCPGNDTISFRISVLPAPILTSDKTASVCDNAPFTYTATSSFTLTSFKWKRSFVAGIRNPLDSGVNVNINEALDNLTALPKVVTYIFTFSAGIGCTSTDSMKLTVNPTPLLNPVEDTTFCNGAFVNLGIPLTSSSPGASFRWINSNRSIGLPDSGHGSIPAFIATNTTNNPVTATITVNIKASSDSCKGPDSSFTITVRPAPRLISIKDTSVCDNIPFFYTATSSVTGSISGWTRDTVKGIRNLAGSNSTATINETLDNTTLQPVKVTYFFTMSSNTGCITKDSVKVTVNPTPVIKQVVDTIFCDGAFVNLGIPFSSESPAASFRWKNSDTTIGLRDSSGRGSIPPFITRNNDSIPKAAIITVSVKASADSCNGPDSSFRITVYPLPRLISLKTVGICNHSPFIYTAKSYSSTNITSFSWSRDSVPGISNPKGSGAIPVINETLHNTDTMPLVVSYVFKMSTRPGCVNTDTVKVTVYPDAKVNAIPDMAFCNGSLVQRIELTSPNTPAFLKWAVDTTIGFGKTGNGNIPAFVASNQGTDSVTAHVTIFDSVFSGCRVDTSHFTIKVYPVPIITSLKEISVCDTVPFIYMAKSSAGATRFAWKRDSVPGISNSRRFGIPGANIIETLHNTTEQPVMVTYVFTLSTGVGVSCVTTDSVKVTVNPTPRLVSIPNDTFCHGIQVGAIKFSSRSPNPSFKWIVDKTIGFGSSGKDSIPAFTATNTGTVPIVATVTVSITASRDSCRGSDSTFRITVNPAPPNPAFTSLSGFPNSDTLHLCSGSENINFNVSAPIPGISYSWTSTADKSRVLIRDTIHANTVISFYRSGIDTVRLITKNTLGGCTNTVSQIVKVDSPATGIAKRPIFLKQPGNLLIYPDNSLTRYQWGYDTVIRTSPDSSFGAPVPVQGQVYQVFIPGVKFTGNNNGPLNEANYLYWVLLQNGGCYTRSYYNGPYANSPFGVITTDNNIQLKIIPNPNKGIFEIALKGNIYGSISAKIHNATGQVVFNKNFIKVTPDMTEKMNTNNLPAGLYFLVLYSSDLKTVGSRFIIQH